ncbi:MAG: hypothetical protein R3E52_13460 [Burkholderiaceae bacterium]
MEGLEMSGHGKWRTAPCVFHGGGDSMRINTDTGGFICMNCGAKGGDVLAYRMAAQGEDFITAARALGCWIDDDKPPPRRPTPISPRDALALLAAETSLVATAAANVAHGVVLTQIDLNRLLTAASRIANIGELFA